MRTVLPCLWLVASLCGSAVATESQHSVVVDTPEVITLTHATPDTWHTLPPIQPYHVNETTWRLTYAACRSGVQLVFAPSRSPLSALLEQTTHPNAAMMAPFFEPNSCCSV